MPPQSDEDEDHSALQELESSVINTTDPLLTAPPNVTPSKSKEPFSVLGRIPDDIEEFRERVFRLDEPASFDAATWEKYWP